MVGHPRPPVGEGGPTSKPERILSPTHPPAAWTGSGSSQSLGAAPHPFPQAQRLVSWRISFLAGVFPVNYKAGNVLPVVLRCNGIMSPLGETGRRGQ